LQKATNDSNSYVLFHPVLQAKEHVDNTRFMFFHVSCMFLANLVFFILFTILL